MESIGERIKQIRQDRKLSQQEFAEKLSVSRSFISRVEHNKENPSETLLKLISWSFECDFDWLTNGSGKKYSDYKEKQLLQKEIIKSDLVNKIDFAQDGHDYYTKISLSKSIQSCYDIFNINGALSSSQKYYEKKAESLIVRLGILAKLSPTLDEDIIEATFDGLKSQVCILLDEIERCFFEEDLDDLLEEESQE
ncbi:MAG: helix-turn-helix transcriptional regulator [Oscillospiraceae bacterium]|nr:helix-turn-helix transcriptional regulator [Oscillospiraceae bacterium]